MHVQLSGWLFAHVSAIKSRQSGQAGEVDAKGGGGSRGSEQWGGRAYFFNRRPVKRLTTGTEGTQLWTMKFDNDDDYDDDVVACCCKLNRFCSTERPRDLRLSLQHCSFPQSRLRLPLLLRVRLCCPRLSRPARQPFWLSLWLRLCGVS